MDLGIVRGLAYYTGPVFEIFDIGKGMRPLPAEAVTTSSSASSAASTCPLWVRDGRHGHHGPDPRDGGSRRETRRAVAEAGRVDAYVVLADPSKEAEAARVAHDLRSAGLRVLSPLAPAKVAKQFQAAEQSGARHAVVVGAEFPLLTVRDLSDRSERSLPVDGIAASLG